MKTPTKFTFLGEPRASHGEPRRATASIFVDFCSKNKKSNFADTAIFYVFSFLYEKPQFWSSLLLLLTFDVP